MASRNFRKSLKRNTLTLALGMCLVSPGVFAQSAVGSLFGNAEAGAKVVVTNAETGMHREVAADSSGRFNLTQLAPGNYTVTVDGKSRDVVVRVGTGTQVNLASGDTTTLSAIVVTGSTVNAIDVSSVESSSTFSAKQLQALPIVRDVTNVALLAPGTVKGDTGFGNLASFGGSSVAENGYYINGFDVTNVRNFLSFATLPFEALGSQQIKTGGYGAEYGRSLGGVVSIVTKRGTNEWEGGASVYWTPDWGRAAGKDVLSRDPDDLANGDVYLAYRSRNEDDNFKYNVYGGGPLIKDRLFVFGLLEGTKSSTDTFGRTTSQRITDNTPNGMIKVDWNITDNHIFEATAIRDKTKQDITDFEYANDRKYVGRHEDVIADTQQRDGGNVYIGKYTGYLTDTFTVSAQYGHLENTNAYVTPEALPGAECVRAFDSRANRGAANFVGCWNQSQVFIRDPNFGPDKDTRDGYRIDAEWRLGDHQLRFGWDKENFDSGHAGTTYTGGEYWRHFLVTEATGRRVNGVTLAQGTSYARRWIRDTTSGTFNVTNEALYLEDNWQITDNVLVYAGVRSESFANENADGDTFVEANDKIAPRLGASWDVKGDGSMKVFANAGRYYIPVASNTNIRASGGELNTEEFFISTGFDPATGLPTGLGAQIGPTNVNGDGNPPNSATVAATNLSPMYQDEFILGFQMDLGNSWSAGTRIVHREVKSGMDDFCGVQAFQNWADDNGHTNFDVGSLASCFILNPGKDVGIALDLEGDGNLTNVTIPSSYFGLPKYQRSYNAVEIFFEKATDKWSLQGSYTWSQSYGNVEGYVNSSLEQDDAGLTQDFDFPVFEDGANGYLPNDRRHVFKAFGSYQLNDEWSLGGNFVLSSGRPVNCLGFAPVGDDLDSGSLAFYGSSSFYCKQSDDSVVLGRRGQEGRTPWTWVMDASVTYVPAWADKKLLMKATVYNVFQMQRVTEFQETSSTGSATSNTFDPNFLNNLNYQTPRSIELSARYEF